MEGVWDYHRRAAGDSGEAMIDPCWLPAVLLPLAYYLIARPDLFTNHIYHWLTGQPQPDDEDE